MSEISKCAICSEPLYEPEIRLNRQWHFDCEKCTICGAEMPNGDQIRRCIQDSQPIAHTTCLKTKLFQDFKNQTLPVTKSHIDALNSEINSFFPAVNPDVADIKILYDLLISLQECATNVSYALSLTKDKLLVRESQTFNHQTKQKQAAEAQARIETESEKLARQKKTEMFAAERADETGMLRARRKTIDGFIAIGLTKEQAEEMVRQQEIKSLERKIQ